ncbi:MAG: family N-acetyltransferase [Hyphomicrobiales bacterium]|nr:family N-acetyltransferase [Hyphomicrobiales bacterium]
MSSSPLRLRTIRSLGDVEAARWDACANPENPDGARQATLRKPEAAPEGDESLSQKERFNPFLCHRFLSALETSGSAVRREGWGPSHLLVEEEDGTLLAAAPAYLKSHSMGEYVFDHAWADAFERAGGRYYPKLQVAVPFTPASGRRLLVAEGERADEARSTLIAGLRALRENARASSTHVTFPTRTEWDALGAAGWLQRTGRQFHFFNRGYADFDAFLAALASRKRKNIRKEREQALGAGIEVFSLTGSDITEAHWDAFFEFYMDTGARKWGTPYLTRAFFSEIGATMAERILLVMARRAGRWIAGAINFIGDDALYGRNWGAIEEHPCLHFELCYYRAIDFALARGISRVEAGAQGEHKLARGYEPVTTYSAHEFADPRLARAVAGFLEQERDHVEAEIEIYGEHVPFKKG